ncbi:L-threonylcarbamoyladenylate synthase [Bacillus halotolerans]|uniref:Threonylcarbamoyl-AMP synthase n=1 Tax=Bacillus halotolerans TaxID=260554 RepID=A0ABY7HZH3_9BACI|nr:L-threonylcarbamoyladenylate synthase [Bacillus halotolerans]KUP36353.1 tRNA threonylcarbamoyladenosine biosynthesis protein [Bacillus halotolerans]MBT9248600.1 threonylcarbamoyl-AMP synthase [Bacillus halotolerans]MDG0764589.1 threonylcarbamoyl-AMP synthase [Bacillus halotolerans]MDG3072494.1 L-threonylcarbamoyladenylate synthase [Bacillus halotolerans]MDL5610352.1 L-threonylcarbamoyladenylate synthase [Bacillus halotolerans]
MKTKRWFVDVMDELSTNDPQIAQAAALLRGNEVVAFPTETVYGLGANAKSTDAVKKIYEAKGRPSDNPLIVHIADISQLDGLTGPAPDKAKILMKRFWPGALTLILPCTPGALSPRVTAGLDTVAVRMPDHPLALALIRAAGLPIAAPSANLSGKPSPTKAEHVAHDLDGRIAGLMDGGSTGIGVESTVLSCAGETPVLLRPGGITKEQIEAEIGPILVDKGLADQNEKPISPGMKYTHYAPSAPLVISEGSPERIQTLIQEYQQGGKRVGVLTTEENADFYSADYVKSCGRRDQLETVAAALYDALRSFDEEKVDFIIAESFPDTGVGLAIMNRLMKAAGGRVIR